MTDATGLYPGMGPWTHLTGSLSAQHVLADDAVNPESRQPTWTRS